MNFRVPTFLLFTLLSSTYLHAAQRVVPFEFRDRYEERYGGGDIDGFGVHSVGGNWIYTVAFDSLGNLPKAVGIIRTTWSFQDPRYQVPVLVNEDTCEGLRTIDPDHPNFIWDGKNWVSRGPKLYFPTLVEDVLREAGIWSSSEMSSTAIGSVNSTRTTIRVEEPPSGKHFVRAESAYDFKNFLARACPTK